MDAGLVALSRTWGDDVPMTTGPLDALEQRAWLALGRMMIVLPRALDDHLQRATGLPMTTYAVLMHLSSAPDGQLRMSELADLTALSPSRMTRVIDQLQRQGQVQRFPCAKDGRGTLACITDLGRERLRQAWPDHLNSVRTLVIDQLDTTELRRLASLAERINAAVDAAGAGHPQAG